MRNDITRMQVDAVVNTANESVGYGSGLDTAVYRTAGERELLNARAKIGRMQQGDAAVTPGFRLPAKYIIHAVSPFYIDGNSGEEKLLRSCYRKSLMLAREKHCRSIAFPLISTGGYGYPKEEGMRVAVDEINAFLMKYEMLVYLVVFDAEATTLGTKLYPDLESYIDSHYVMTHERAEYGPEKFEEARVENLDLSDDFDLGDEGFQNESSERRSRRTLDISRTLAGKPELQEQSYEDFITEKESALQKRMRHMSDTFQQYLLYLIEQKHLTNAEVYKRAIITKQLFSKIKLNETYHPDKATAMRLCIGAKLNLDETRDLLARAGYALSPCDRRDIIFSYFIEKQIYDMIEIDITLEEHGLPCFIE